MKAGIMKVARKMNKRGSTAVFLTMIFACMAAVALVFSYAAAQAAYVSRCDAICALSGRSILSEFDLTLKEEYGIFGFYGYDMEIEAKLQYYINMSLGSKDVSHITVDLSQYGLTNIDTFEQQIINAAKYGFIKAAIQKVTSSDGNEVVMEMQEEDKILQNQIVINSLPSTAIETSRFSVDSITSKVEGITNITAFLKEGSDLYLTTDYILRNCRHEFQTDVGRETFFTREVEYILNGKYSDKENKRAFKNDFVALRTPLNLAHIYADPKKRAETLSAAELLTPGPAAVVTQGIIALGWAVIEARNDAALLLAGENVALTKTQATWAINFSNILVTENADSFDTSLKGSGSSYIKPTSSAGLSYEDYLKLFLSFQNRTTKLVRLMDLIQLNMKGIYYDGFLLREYNAGVEYDVWIKGKKYVFEEKY